MKVELAERVTRMEREAVELRALTEENNAKLGLILGLLPIGDATPRQSAGPATPSQT